MTIAAITFYSLVLFVHVAAVVMAFGVLFTYPLIVPMTERTDPASLPQLYRLRVAIGQQIVTPLATLVLLAGIYLAIDGPYDFGEWWVGLGLLIIVVVLGIVGGFLTPNERRLAALAAREAAPGTGGRPLSDEYREVSRRLAAGSGAAAALVLVAIFVMVMGSRGYL